MVLFSVHHHRDVRTHMVGFMPPAPVFVSIRISMWGSCEISATLTINLIYDAGTVGGGMRILFNYTSYYLRDELPEKNGA